MTWTALTKPTQGHTTKKSLADTIIDDLNHLYDNMASGTLVENGSFENGTSPTDPTGWVSYKWGTGDIETTDPGHGAQGYKFTSVGSGGGYLTMADFAECSQYELLAVGFFLKSSVADILNIVRVLWYKADQTACTTASTDIYSDATANPTAWTHFVRAAVPPDTARFFKLRLIGADSSDATNGNCIYDGVEAWSTERLSYRVYGTMAEATDTTGAYVDKGTVTVPLPTNLSTSSIVRITFIASIKFQEGGGAGVNTASQRFRVGTFYSNEVTSSSLTYVESVYELTYFAATGGNVTLTQQLKGEDAGTDIAYGKKDKSSITVDILAI